MKLHFVLVSLFSVVFGSTIRSDEENNNLGAGARDLTYHFFSQKNPVNFIDIKLGQNQLLINTPFDVSKDTLFLIHGWKADNDSEFNTEITGLILASNDINVFVVDWSPIAGANYVSAKGAVVRVGQYVAEFINALKDDFGLILDQVKFVGWSLGAHICGNAGAALGGKVDRITGLDPAGPLFSAKNINERLDKTDAQYVQVIHTSSTLGIQIASGHADYYPNGGASQPGCGLDFLGGCSHSRVFSLYSESLWSSGFVARRCASWKDYKNNKCSNNPASLLGRFVPDNSVEGIYYLATNKKAPFAQG